MPSQVHELISLTASPTMPSPWTGDGELSDLWSWGDFFIAFLVDPPSMSDATALVAGTLEKPPGMRYHYSAIAYYKLERNPHGPSHRPVVVYSIEQVTSDGVRQMRANLEQSMGKQAVAELEPDNPPLVIGAFVSGGMRFNLGEYSGSLDLLSARSALFEAVGKELDLSGEAVRIGHLGDAWGHPQTGLPDREDKARNSVTGAAIREHVMSKSRKGCLGALPGLLLVL